MSETITLTLCLFCQERGRLSPEATVDHLIRLFEDVAVLQALTMIHGEKAGFKRYVEVGGLVHTTEADAREIAAQHGVPIVGDDEEE